MSVRGLNTTLLALVVCVPLAGYVGYRAGGDACETAHVDALRAAELKNAERTKQLVRGVEKIVEENRDAQAEIELRLADADDAVERLREAVRDADARADTTAAGAADAAAARASLADCAGKYRDMARDVDRLRATVIGLQSYAKEVSRPSK